MEQKNDESADEERGDPENLPAGRAEIQFCGLKVILEGQREIIGARVGGKTRHCGLLFNGFRGVRAVGEFQRIAVDDGVVRQPEDRTGSGEY